MSAPQPPAPNDMPGGGQPNPYGQELDYAPEARSRRSLIIAVIILLLAVVALAIALILTLMKDDGNDAGPPQPTPTVSAQPAAEPTAHPTEAVAEEPSSPLQYTDNVEALSNEQHRDADDPYAQGDPDADIVIVEYADYRCGYCALWATTVKPTLMEQVEAGKVRLEFRDMPVLGEESVSAAMAARAAGNQGKFFEYQEALFGRTADAATNGAGHPTFDEETLKEIAAEVGVEDLDAFAADMTDEKVREEVLALREHNSQLGISGTPFFIIYDGYLSGFLPVEQFIPVVSDQVEKAQADGKAGTSL